MKKTEIEKYLNRPVLIERREKRPHVIGVLADITATCAVIVRASIICDDYFALLSRVATGGHQTIFVPLNRIERMYEIEIV